MKNCDENAGRVHRLGERYRLRSVLAKGGMSILFAALDEKTGNEVAVKLMHTRGAFRNSRRQRFEHEIKTTRLLKHPNIVVVLDSEDDESGEPYFVMELLRGRSLEEELGNRGTIPVAQALQWLLPLMGALAHAHDRGIVHRDIKPSNIFLSRTEDETCVPKLLDFGIAMASSAGDARFTTSGVVVGTVQYMSPEHARDADVGPPADVWSLAAVLFRCLTGHAPFESESVTNLLLKIVRTPAPSLVACAPDVGKRLAFAIDRGLRKDVDSRYCDMRQFARALCLNARAEGIAVPQDPDPIGLPQWQRWCSEDIPEVCLTQEIESFAEPATEEGYAFTEGKYDLAGSSYTPLPTRIAFVGRERERTSLDEWLHKAAHSSAQVVGIVAEAGIGKSRLLLEWRQNLSLFGYRYLEGRCTLHGDFTVYAPIRDILRRYFAIKEGDRESIILQQLVSGLRSLGEPMSKWLAPLAELFSLSAEDQTFNSLEPRQKRELIFQAVTFLFLRIAEDRPLIIAIEDVHWIDKSSEELLGHFFDLLKDKSILVILLYRPQYKSPWTELSNFRQLEIEPLGIDSTAALVKSITGNDEVDVKLSEFIYDRSYGNPLFVEELTRALLQNGTIVRRNGRCMLHSDAFSIPYPQTVQGIIAERIDMLEENIKRTVQMAAVIGPDFASGILQNISGMQEEIQSHLSKLRGLELIREKSPSSESDFSFVHTLTQEVAYHGLVAEKRKESHQKIGETIESIYSERLDDFFEILAVHFYNADNWIKACRYAKLAGDKAARNYSNSEAVNFFERAIDALKRLPRTKDVIRDEADVRLALDMSLGALGYPKGSLENMNERVDLAMQLEDVRGLAVAYSRINTYFSHLGKPLEGRAYTEKAFEQILKTDDIESLASITVALCESYSLSGDYNVILRFAPRVVTLIEEANKKREYFLYPINLYSWICARLVAAFAIVGDFENAFVYAEKARGNAIEISNAITYGAAELVFGVIWLIKGNGARVVERLLISIDHIEKTGWSWLLSTAYPILSIAYGFLGDDANALKFTEKALKEQEKTEAFMLPGFAEIAAGLVQHSLGNYTDSSSYFSRSIATATERGDKFVKGLSGIFLGRSIGAESTSRGGEAAEEVLKGIRVLEQIESRVYSAIGYFFLGEIQLNIGDLKAGKKNIVKAERTLTELNEEYWLKEAREVLKKIS